jgi:hypothetical protein
MQRKRCQKKPKKSRVRTCCMGFNAVYSSLFASPLLFRVCECIRVCSECGRETHTHPHTDTHTHTHTPQIQRHILILHTLCSESKPHTPRTAENKKILKCHFHSTSRLTRFLKEKSIFFKKLLRISACWTDTTHTASNHYTAPPSSPLRHPPTPSPSPGGVPQSCLFAAWRRAWGGRETGGSRSE